MNNINSSSLRVSGLGLITSVGMGLDESCASVRAGINRFCELGGLNLIDSDNEQAIVCGAPVAHLTHGFARQSAWIRLAEMAFLDLINSNSILQKSDYKFWNETPVIFVLPDIIERRFSSIVDGNISDFLLHNFVAPLSKKLGIPIVIFDNSFITEGSGGLPRALAALARSMSSGYLKRALVFAIDSLVDPLTLKVLYEANRLKTEDNPIGLTPGEAAGCLFVESLDGCIHQGQESLPLMLRSVHSKFSRSVISKQLSDEDNKKFKPGNWRRENAIDIGLSLAGVIEDCLSVIGDSVFCGDIYIDLNGEEWKAVAWGMAVTKLKMKNKIDFDSSIETIPALSLGELGASYSAVAISLTNASYQRSYSKSSLTLVCSISDNGNVGAMLLNKRDPSTT